MQQLEAYQELLVGKQDSIERAYLAVRKIVGGDRFEFKSQRLGSSFPETEQERAAEVRQFTQDVPRGSVLRTEPESVKPATSYRPDVIREMAATKAESSKTPADPLRAAFGSVRD